MPAQGAIATKPHLNTLHLDGRSMLDGLRLVGGGSRLQAGDRGCQLLGQAVALRDELGMALDRKRRQPGSGSVDPFAVVRGRSSLEQAFADAHALVRCLEEDLRRRDELVAR